MTQNNFVRTLTNLRSLRSIGRELTVEQLAEGLRKLQLVHDERKQEEDIAKEAEMERQAKLDSYLEQIKADGIDPQELVQMLEVGSSPKKAKAKRAPRPPKYEYLDENGKICTWTGQGRTPLLIQNELDSGKSLEDFLIK